jgi:hypothetical protein
MTPQRGIGQTADARGARLRDVAPAGSRTCSANAGVRTIPRNRAAI